MIATSLLLNHAFFFPCVHVWQEGMIFVSSEQQWYNKGKGGLKGENLGREDENTWESRGKLLGLVRKEQSLKVKGKYL